MKTNYAKAKGYNLEGYLEEIQVLANPSLPLKGEEV